MQNIEESINNPLKRLSITNKNFKKTKVKQYLSYRPKDNANNFLKVSMYQYDILDIILKAKHLLYLII